jgi:hypothetical protein
VEQLPPEHRVDNEPIARRQLARQLQQLEDGADLAAVGPGFGDDGRDPRRVAAPTVCTRPLRGGPEILVLTRDVEHRLHREPAVERLADGIVAVMLEMAVPYRVGVPGLLEPGSGEQSDRFEESMARRTRTVALDVDERLCDERVDPVDDFGLAEPGDPDHPGSVKAAVEHREHLQQRLLGRGEQVVGPLHRGLERRLPRPAPTTRGAQHSEPVVEPAPELGEIHASSTGRGELDRERQPVERVNDLRDQRVSLGALR